MLFDVDRLGLNCSAFNGKRFILIVMKSVSISVPVHQVGKDGLVGGHDMLLDNWLASTLRLASQHIYDVRPRKDKRGVELISDALPFSSVVVLLIRYRPAISYAKHRIRSHDALICVYDEAGNVIGTNEHTGDFKEP